MDNLPEILTQEGLAKDEYWAKQFIKQGLITVDGVVVLEENTNISIGSTISKIGCIIKCGKRKWLKVINTDVIGNHVESY